jgi:hypothetical protein
VPSQVRIGWLLRRAGTLAVSLVCVHEIEAQQSRKNRRREKKVRRRMLLAALCQAFSRTQSQHVSVSLSPVYKLHPSIPSSIPFISVEPILAAASSSAESSVFASPRARADFALNPGTLTSSFSRDAQARDAPRLTYQSTIYFHINLQPSSLSTHPSSPCTTRIVA